jgi:flagellar assembly factor FliW
MNALKVVQGSAPEYVAVASSLFGEIKVRAQDVLEFPSGLLGFPECRNFALIAGQSHGTYWLQSIEHPVLVFLLVDPFLAFHGYTVDLVPQDLSALKISSPDDVAILAIVTLSRSPDESSTANLQGPLAINLKTRTGKQVTIDQPGFGIRVPVDLKKLAESQEAESSQASS